MGALVRFDADGRWGDTLVCDGLIGQQLAQAGIGFGRWPVRALPERAGGEGADNNDRLAEVRVLYGEELAALQGSFGSFEVRSADRVHIEAGRADWPEMRQKFLAEHTHTDAEIRFFLDGAALFYVRTGDGFIGLLCEAGEWVALPAGTRHFFDAGETPGFDALRLFAEPHGWVAQPTGAVTPTALPLYDDFVEQLLTLTGHEAEEEFE